MHTQDDREYDDNANFDDVFETKHVVQAIEDIHITTAYNNNYKLYFGDEYHDFNQMSQKCVENERVSKNTIQSHPHAYVHKMKQSKQYVLYIFRSKTIHMISCYIHEMKSKYPKSKDSINKF